MWGALRLQHLELVLLQRVHLVGRRGQDEVDLAGAQGGHARGGIVEAPEHQLVHVGLRAPVLLEALEHDAVARHVLHELEGAGAHRGVGELLVARLLHLRRADHHRLTPALQRHPLPLRVGLAERHLERVVVDRLHARDVLDHVVGVAVGPRVEMRRVLLEHALPGEDGGLGVEGGAVVELDALPQLEGPGETVLGQRVGLGELRDHLRDRHVGPGEVFREQALEHLEGHAIGQPAAGGLRVQDVGRALHAVDERAALLRRLGPRALRHGERAGGTRRAGGRGAKEVAAAHVGEHPQHEVDLLSVHGALLGLDPGVTGARGGRGPRAARLRRS